MSNTDGEDKQRIKAKQILTEAIGKDCVFSIDGKMWNVGNLNANTIVDSMLKYVDQELASLREQLERAKYALSIMEGNRDRLFDQLKQKEDENRELVQSIKEMVPILESALTSAKYGYDSKEYCAELELLIKKANNLSA